MQAVDWLSGVSLSLSSLQTEDGVAMVASRLLTILKVSAGLSPVATTALYLSTLTRCTVPSELDEDWPFTPLPVSDSFQIMHQYHSCWDAWSLQLEQEIWKMYHKEVLENKSGGQLKGSNEVQSYQLTYRSRFFLFVTFYYTLLNSRWRCVLVNIPEPFLFNFPIHPSWTWCVLQLLVYKVFYIM